MRENNTKKATVSAWSLDQGAQNAALDMTSNEETARRFPTKKGVLTQAEIEFLLRPELPDDLPVASPPEHISPRAEINFDNGLSRTIPAAEEQAAKALAARLSFLFAQSTGMKAAFRLSDIQSHQSSDLSGVLSQNIGAVACFGHSETETELLVALPAPLADAMIAQACGARGSTGRIGDGWVLSAIDCALLEQLLGPIAPAFGGDLALLAIETDIPYVTSLLPAGNVLVGTYAVESPSVQTQICIVAGERSPAPKSVPNRPTGTRAPITAVLTARIASLSVPMSRLTSLKAGSTLLLGLPPDQPVELLSGDREGLLAFEGQVGRKGNKVAVKISRKVRGVLE